jgi:DnaJ like chaperone protein
MRGELLSAMLAAYRASHRHGAYQGPQSAVTNLAQAYAALGLEENATAAEIKKAYRRLVAQYHPDRLESRGLPAGMMDKARNRVREINAAYDRLKAARGIK